MNLFLILLNLSNVSSDRSWNCFRCNKQQFASASVSGSTSTLRNRLARLNEARRLYRAAHHWLKQSNTDMKSVTQSQDPRFHNSDNLNHFSGQKSHKMVFADPNSDSEVVIHLIIKLLKIMLTNVFITSILLVLILTKLMYINIL